MRDVLKTTTLLYFIFLVVGLFSCKSEEQKDANNKDGEEQNDLSFLYAYQGKTFDEIINADNAYFNNRMKELAKEDYQKYTFPIRQGQEEIQLLDSLWLVVYGSAEHPGGRDESAIVLDLVNDNLCMGLWESATNEITKTCENESLEMPPPFAQWVNNSN